MDAYLDGSRVASIATVHLGPIEDHCADGGATQVDIKASVIQFLIALDEGFPEDLIILSIIGTALDVLLVVLAADQGLTHVLCHQLGEAHLDEVGGFLAVLSMAVTDPKVVSEVARIQIRVQNEAVLVYFIRVVGDVAHPGGKGVLRDHIPFNELRDHRVSVVWLAVEATPLPSVHDLGRGRGGRLKLRIKLHILVIRKLVV